MVRAAPARQKAQPALGDDRAHGEQHGIRAGDVIVAAFADPEQCQRNQVHEGQHAIAAVEQEADQPGQPQRRGGRVGADEELVLEKSVGAAFAHVARVNVLKKV